MMRSLWQHLTGWLAGPPADPPPAAPPFVLPSLPDAAPMPIRIEAWHGGGTLFDRFSLTHVGAGEGAHALGWGIYFSEDRRLGVYNAEKRKFDGQGPGALYEVVLHLDRNRVISLDQPDSDAEQRIAQEYERLRSEMGDRAAAHWLQRIGVQAVRAYEQEFGATGDTVVCLVDDVIEIRARYRMVGPAQWEAVHSPAER